MDDCHERCEAEAKLSAIPRVAERLKHLQEKGVVVPAENPARTLATVVRRKGALWRFLADRGE